MSKIGSKFKKYLFPGQEKNDFYTNPDQDVSEVNQTVNEVLRNNMNKTITTKYDNLPQIFKPIDFNAAITISDYIISYSNEVIIDLANMPSEQQKLFMHFISGVVYACGKKITESEKLIFKIGIKNEEAY